MITNLIYVYCISNSLPEPNKDFDTKGLKFLMLNGFCVTIKYVSENEFSEENFKKNISDLQWLETNAREHIREISLLMESGTVVPFKFGTIFKTEESLKKFVSDYSDSLIENLNYLNGKEEWAVKIFCDRKILNEQIDELSEEAAKLEAQIMASSPGKAFILKRKKSDLVEEELDRLCKIYGQKYYNTLKYLSEETKINNILPKEYTGRKDNMILNATFLLYRNNVVKFKNAVTDFLMKDKNSGFFIEITGPWAPFSFISIKEK